MADGSALGGEKNNLHPQPKGIKQPVWWHQQPVTAALSAALTKAALWLSSDHPLPHFRLQLRFMQIPAFLLHNLKQNVEHATIYDIHINRKHAKKLVV